MDAEGEEYWRAELTHRFTAAIQEGEDSRHGQRSVALLL